MIGARAEAHPGLSLAGIAQVEPQPAHGLAIPLSPSWLGSFAGGYPVGQFLYFLLGFVAVDFFKVQLPPDKLEKSTEAVGVIDIVLVQVRAQERFAVRPAVSVDGAVPDMPAPWSFGQRVSIVMAPSIRKNLKVKFTHAALLYESGCSQLLQ
jgi:hypothetical protein